MNILLSVGTRPNFIKITQFRKAAAELGANISIVHTGQHYDRFMSGVFFDQFQLHPDHFLALNSKNAYLTKAIRFFVELKAKKS